jgi:hypothetical protein
MKEAMTTLLLLESNGQPTPILVLKLCLQLLPVGCMVMPRLSSKDLVSVLLASSNGPNLALATTFHLDLLLHQPLETQVDVLLVNVNPNGDTVEMEMTTVVKVAKLDLAVVNQNLKLHLLLHQFVLHHHHQPLEIQVDVLLVNVNPNGDSVELEMTTVVKVAKLDLAKVETNVVADVVLARAAPNGAIAVLDLPTVEVETVKLVRMNKLLM